MHISLRIVLLIAFALTAECSKALGPHREAIAISYDQEIEDVSDGYVTLRDGRRLKSKQNARFMFGILDDIIDFESGICSTGTCMSQKGCVAMNGTDSTDRCVQGFGVCCVTGGGYDGGNVTIGPEGGDFFNPGELDAGRPSITPTVVTRQSNITEDPVYQTIIITINPPADAVQMVITLKSLNILGPDEGSCDNDTLKILGGNPGPEIPTLCGLIDSDQEVYVGIDNSDGPYEIEIKLLLGIDYPAEFKGSVGYRTKSDPALQRRCLQYPTGTEGTIESFNFNMDPPGMMLSDQVYSICFGYVNTFCNIAFSFARLDLDCTEGQYLFIGDNQYCGDHTDYQVIANATGPINVGVRSGSNMAEAEGFSANYTMMGC